MIRRYKYLLFACVLFSSCATILHSPVQRVVIITDKRVQVLAVEKATFIDSSLASNDFGRAYYVIRNSRPLRIDLAIDTLTKKSLYLKPKNSLAFWYNIFFNYGIGMLVDMNNPKRYRYRRNNYISATGTITQLPQLIPDNKGAIDFTTSFQLANIFHINLRDSVVNEAGAFGLEIGINYFHKPKQYLSANIGAGFNGTIGESFGPRYIVSASTIYTNVLNNYVFGRFDLGYGINISQLRWARKTIGDTINLDRRISNTVFGFSGAANYRLGRGIKFGVLYHPALFNVNFKTQNYQQYISFRLIGKFTLKKSKKLNS